MVLDGAPLEDSHAEKRTRPEVCAWRLVQRGAFTFPISTFVPNHHLQRLGALTFPMFHFFIPPTHFHDFQNFEVVKVSEDSSVFDDYVCVLIVMT